MLMSVVDCEMNSLPDGARGLGRLIQIGAVAMDLKSGKVKSDFMAYVNPEETLSDRIVALTGITQEKVDGGLPLAEALQKFWGWAASQSSHLAAWGDDIAYLQGLSRTVGVNEESITRFYEYDIKETAAIARCAFPQKKARGGLGDTITTFGMEFQGRQHDALDDAYNTAYFAHKVVKIVRAFYDMKALANAT